MRWLLHGQLTAAVREALHRHGHQTHTLSDVQIEASDPSEVLASAQRLQLDVITSDPALAAAPFDRQTPFGRSIVFLQLAGGELEQNDAVDRLFERYSSPSPARLYTVTASRVKVRQLPGRS